MEEKKSLSSIANKSGNPEQSSGHPPMIATELKTWCVSSRGGTFFFSSPLRFSPDCCSIYLWLGSQLCIVKFFYVPFFPCKKPYKRCTVGVFLFHILQGLRYIPTVFSGEDMLAEFRCTIITRVSMFLRILEGEWFCKADEFVIRSSPSRRILKIHNLHL